MSTDLEPVEIPLPLNHQSIQARPGVTTVRMAELGARAGALGLEASKVNRLVAALQTSAHTAALDTLEGVLGEVQDLLDARLNTLLQAVRALPGSASSVGVREWFQGKAGVDMVMRDQVLLLITEQMGRKPGR